MLVAVCCVPHQSWTNLAESCMPILNFALQYVVLDRKVMDVQYETAVSKVLLSLHERKLQTESPRFVSSILSPWNQSLLHWIVSFMDELEEESVTTHDLAVEVFFSTIHAVHPSVDASMLTKAVWEMQGLCCHCKSDHYSFQVKRCTSSLVMLCRAFCTGFREHLFLPTLCQQLIICTTSHLVMCTVKSLLNKADHPELAR